MPRSLNTIRILAPSIVILMALVACSPALEPATTTPAPTLLGRATAPIATASSSKPTTAATPAPANTPHATPAVASQASGVVVPTARRSDIAATALPYVASVAQADTLRRISIPRLSLEVPLVSTSWHIEVIEGEPIAVWDTPNAAAGHHKGSALPGQEGNCVISGHSRADKGGVFYGLWDLVISDEIMLYDEAGKAFRYRVSEMTTLPELGEDLVTRRSNALTAMGPTEEERLTLITCWPDWAYTHRLVVVATPG